LQKSPDDITFWDVVEAVEGISPIFQCQNIIAKSYLYREKDNSDCSSCTPSAACSINLVMLEAEEQMRNYLKSKTLSWLDEELDRVLPEKTRADTRAYFAKND
jgi:DNA-binding IscR family transcriptional regulator